MDDFDVPKLLEIVEIAYRWRAAEIHTAACILGIRNDGQAQEKLDRILDKLRMILDKYEKVW